MSKIALERAVDSIFADEGVRGLGHALFVHKEWLTGVTTESFLLTLEDYIADLNEWLDPPFFKRAVQVLSLPQLSVLLPQPPIPCSLLNLAIALPHIRFDLGCDVAAVLKEHRQSVLQGVP